MDNPQSRRQDVRRAYSSAADTFLEEFRVVGFRESVILRTIRNARTKDKRVLAAEIYASIKGGLSREKTPPYPNKLRFFLQVSFGLTPHGRLGSDSSFTDGAEKVIRTVHPYVLITTNCPGWPCSPPYGGEGNRKLPVPYRSHSHSIYGLVSTSLSGVVGKGGSPKTMMVGVWQGPVTNIGVLPSVLPGLLPTPNSQLALPNINSLLKGTSSLSTW